MADDPSATRPRAYQARAASTASLPMDTLSAPDRKYSAATARAEWGVPSGSVVPRMPPPTVSGTNTPSDARRRTSSMGRSPRGVSRKPVMFRKVTSSAPAS
jgi:hypothetical protein